jgi:hypothetical protein
MFVVAGVIASAEYRRFGIKVAGSLCEVERPPERPTGARRLSAAQKFLCGRAATSV